MVRELPPVCLSSVGAQASSGSRRLPQAAVILPKVRTREPRVALQVTDPTSTQRIAQIEPCLAIREDTSRSPLDSFGQIAFLAEPSTAGLCPESPVSPIIIARRLVF